MYELNRLLLDLGPHGEFHCGLRLQATKQISIDRGARRQRPKGWETTRDTKWNRSKKRPTETDADAQAENSEEETICRRCFTTTPLKPETEMCEERHLVPLLNGCT